MKTGEGLRRPSRLSRACADWFDATETYEDRPMDFASPDTADTPSARRTPRGALPVSARAHRTTYHHGDLRNALLQEAIARVTVHGYRALVGREIALALGVAPASAYRHFPSHGHLLASVARMAREDLAQHLLRASTVAASGAIGVTSTVDMAMHRFDAIGRAYVAYAQAFPHRFEIAFANLGVPPDAPDDPSAWHVLTASLQALVDVGAMDARLLAIAPYVAWSAVHGLTGILADAGAARHVWETGAATPATHTAPSEDGAAAIIEGVLDAVKRALGLPVTLPPE